MILQIKPDLATAMRTYRTALIVWIPVGIASWSLYAASNPKLDLFSFEVLSAMFAVVAAIGLAFLPAVLLMYHSARRIKWIVSDEGIEIHKAGGRIRSIPWDHVARVKPGGHTLAIMVAHEPKWEKLPFVSKELGDRLHKLFVAKRVYPFLSSRQ